MGAFITKISAAISSDSTSTLTARPDDSLISLINQIRELVADESREDPIAHSKLLSCIDALKWAAETPLETIYRIGHQSWQNAAIRVALDLGIFDVLIERGPEPVSAKELASRHGADVVLVGRLGHGYSRVALTGD